MKIDNSIYPRLFDKKEFIKYLESNKINRELIQIITQLPETITLRDYKYKIFINKIFYSKGNTYYKFELNYYSEELNEFLLPFKIFSNIEDSVNYLHISLKERNLINNEDN